MMALVNTKNLVAGLILLVMLAMVVATGLSATVLMAQAPPDPRAENIPIGAPFAVGYATDEPLVTVDSGAVLDLVTIRGCEDQTETGPCSNALGENLALVLADISDNIDTALTGSGGAGLSAPARIGWSLDSIFNASELQSSGTTLGTIVPDIFNTAVQPTGHVAVWVGVPQSEVVDIFHGDTSLLNSVFGNLASSTALTVNSVEGTLFVSPAPIQVAPRVGQTWVVVLRYNPFTGPLEEKLRGIQTGAEVNVQADWSVADTTSDSYIHNKPTVGPSVSLSGNTPAAVADTGSAGSGAGASRDDHVHAGVTLNNNTPNPVGTTGRSGTSSHASRSDHVHQGDGAGSGSTNISISRAADRVTVQSSSGNDGIILAAGSGNAAGVMSNSQAGKLAGIETSATADQTPAEIHALIEGDAEDWTLQGNLRLKKGIELNPDSVQAHFDLHPTVTGNERLRLTLGESWPGNTVGAAGNNYRISFIALASPPPGNVRILSSIANTVSIEFTEGTTTFGNVIDAVEADGRLSGELLNGAARSHFLADTGNNTNFTGGAVGPRYNADFTHSAQVKVPVESASDNAVQRSTMDATISNINGQIANIQGALHPSTTVNLTPTYSGTGNSVFSYNLASLISNDLVAPGYFTFTVNNITVRQTLQTTGATTGRAVIRTGTTTLDTVDFHFHPTDPTATLSSQVYFFHWAGHVSITSASSPLTITFSITGPSGATGLSMADNPHNTAAISGRANYDINGAVISAVPQRFYFKQAGQATFYPTARPTGTNLEKAGDSGQASNRHRVRFDGTVVKSAPSGITPAAAGFAFKNSSNDKFIVDGFNGETAAKPDNHSFELGAGTWSLRVECLLGAAFTLYTLQLWQVNPTSGSNLDAVQAMWVSSSGGSETLVFEWSDITLTAAASFYLVFVLGSNENGPGFYNLAVTKH